VLILFGAHLARENEWGFGHGASDWAGSSGKLGILGGPEIGINPGDIIEQADVSISKIDSPDPVCFSNTLTYTLTVTNYGPNQATGVVVTDPLPAGTIFFSESHPLGPASLIPPWARTERSGFPA
jgi:uncharacterized repeat protein (TIGR01451 family)